MVIQKDMALVVRVVNQPNTISPRKRVFDNSTADDWSHNSVSENSTAWWDSDANKAVNHLLRGLDYIVAASSTVLPIILDDLRVQMLLNG